MMIGQANTAIKLMERCAEPIGHIIVQKDGRDNELGVEDWEKVPLLQVHMTNNKCVIPREPRSLCPRSGAVRIASRVSRFLRPERNM
jgi:hypothetical protein